MQDLMKDRRKTERKEKLNFTLKNKSFPLKITSHPVFRTLWLGWRRSKFLCWIRQKNYLTLWILVVLRNWIQEFWRMMTTSMKNHILDKKTCLLRSVFVSGIFKGQCPSQLSNRTLKCLLSRAQVFLPWLLGFLTLELLSHRTYSTIS